MAETAEMQTRKADFWALALKRNIIPIRRIIPISPRQRYDPVKPTHN
jgi:hypothetical protein